MGHSAVIAQANSSDVWAAGDAYERYIGRWSWLVASGATRPNQGNVADRARWLDSADRARICCSGNSSSLAIKAAPQTDDSASGLSILQGRPCHGRYRFAHVPCGRNDRPETPPNGTTKASILLGTLNSRPSSVGLLRADNPVSDSRNRHEQDHATDYRRRCRHHVKAIPRGVHPSDKDGVAQAVKRRSAQVPRNRAGALSHG